VAFERLSATSVLTSWKWNASLAKVAIETKLAATFVRSLKRKEALIGESTGGNPSYFAVSLLRITAALA
jgi:hypothetical protein